MDENKRREELNRNSEIINEFLKNNANIIRPFKLSDFAMFKTLEELSDRLKEGEMSYEKYEHDFLKLGDFEKLETIMGCNPVDIPFRKNDFSNLNKHGADLIGNIKYDILGCYDELSDRLNEWIAPDVYYNINYTCDFLINCKYNSYLDAISDDSYIKNPQNEIWYNRDKDLQNDFDCKYEENFLSGYEKIKDYILYLVGCKNNDLYVSKICPNFGLYIYKNIQKIPWYDQKFKKENQVCLLSKFLDAEQYNFTDSEYFIFEKMLNLNSVLKITEYILDNKIFSITEAIKLNESHTKRNKNPDETLEKRKHLIKDVINCSSAKYSLITYSNVKILEWIFNRIEILKNKWKINFDINSSLNIIKGYCDVLRPMAKNRIECEIVNLFYRQIPNSDKITVDDIKRVKDINYKNFKEKFSDKTEGSCESDVFKRDKLIKIKDKYNIGSEKRVATLSAYINTFVQREILSYNELC